MPGIEQRELQRLRYRQGQIIRGQDFRDQQEIEAQLRAWHNRAIHNTYGVAKGVLDGLAVEAAPDGRNVIVKRGMAYDCFGRELILRDQRLIPFESLTEPTLLVLRHKASSGFCRASEVVEVCSTTGASVAKDTELVWLPVEGFTVRDGVALARTKVDGVSVRLDDAFIALQSRPLARPRIASGTTIPGATTWEVWNVKRSAGRDVIENVFGFQVRIDTSSAGFTTVPAYFASLQGALSRAGGQGGETTLCLQFDHIDEAAIDGFTFRFFITVFRLAPGTAPRPEREARSFLQAQKAYVSWLAVELNPGDEIDS
jgi:hypothetical protein